VSLSVRRSLPTHWVSLALVKGRAVKKWETELTAMCDAVVGKI
jgi:hypothetical protein